MKKKVLFRCLLGAPLGLSLSTIITIVISITVGDGIFYPVAPGLISACGTQLNAVILQTIVSLLYGAAWAGASIIWELEHWSLMRQTATHAVIISLITFPIAYVMYWMPHNLLGVVLYFGIFFGIYILIWLMQYLPIRRRIQLMNQKIQENHREN